MRERGGKRGGDFDHPGYWSPEEMGEAFENADMMFDERVLAEFGEPNFYLGLGKAAGVGSALNRRFMASGLSSRLFLRHLVLVLFVRIANARPAPRSQNDAVISQRRLSRSDIVRHGLNLQDYRKNRQADARKAERYINQEFRMS